MAISAKVIADSISQAGHRLTTFELTYHRYIHSEVMTHRVLSRSSESSRAIPVEKSIDQVIFDPAIPVEWSSEKSGMQGGLPIEESQAAEDVWRSARANAVDSAQRLVELGVHKSIVNRLLEPFKWHTVIVTGTTFQNFFDLRDNPLAQKEFQVLAGLMREAYDASVPKVLQGGWWHMPYIEDEDWQVLSSRGVPMDESLNALKKMSAARCARVSYLNHDGTVNMDKDIELFGKLTVAEPMHSAPLEHVATPWRANVNEYGRPLVGNFLGWRQLRHDVEVAQQRESYR